MKEIEDRPEPARMRGGRAATSGAEPSGVWRSVLEPPTQPCKLIMLYDDGSGARLYYHAGGGQLFCGDDGCEYEWADRDNMALWARLPDSFRLWVETCEEPMTFPALGREAASPLGGPTLTLEEQESVSSNASLPRTLPGAHTNAEPAAEGEP